MFQKITALLISLFIIPSAIAQYNKKNTVTGTVVDQSSGKPIQYASVYILHKSDSSVATGSITDSAGVFSIENLSPGNYILRTSFLGREPKDSVITLTADQKKLNIGRFAVTVSSIKLKEAEIVGETEKQLDISIDKKVYNVGKDIQSSTGSASDILKNVPSIEVNMDGDVSLRGSADVIILINGKPSPLMGRSRAEALQQLPANSIEKIEVITNPSAKYKPDGSSGIINIVMKKNTKSGVHGSVTANAGNNDRYNGNFLVNYKPGKINLYAGGGFRRNNYTRFGTVDRINLDSSDAAESIYTEKNEAPGSSFSQTGNMGIDYDLNDKNSFSASGTIFILDADRNHHSRRILSGTDKMILDDYDRSGLFTLRETEGEGTFVYQHKFNKEDHELQIEATGAFADENEDNLTNYYYYQPATAMTSEKIILRKKDNPKEMVVDYTLPVSEDVTIEAGYSGTFNFIDIDNTIQNYDTLSGIYISDPAKSYRYVYDDKVNALYATYERSIEDFGFIAGLRAEHASIHGNLKTLDSIFTNDYLSFYPSLHLGYELDAGELQLSYSRRVNRPDGDELNPFPEYDDPRNLYAGNSKLLPEYIHSLELGFDMKSDIYSFIPTLYYRYKYNGFTSVTIPLDDSTLLTTEQNLANDQSAGLEMIFSGKPASWISGNISSNIFYTQIDASNLGYSANKSIISAGVNLNSSVTLSKSTMVQVNCSYRSPRVTPQGKYFPYFILNIGAKQEFFKTKLALTVTIADVFKTMVQKSELHSVYFNQTSQSKRDSRVIYFGARFRFGSTVKKGKEESLQFDNTL